MRTAFFVLATACVPAILFGFTLSLPFMSDDFFFIQALSGESYSLGAPGANLYELIDPDTIRHHPYVVPWWTSPEAKLRFLRPLSSLSLWLDYAVWHKNPFGYHLTNLVLHCLSCVFLFLVGRGLTQNNKVASLGVLVFTSNPAVSFVVAWVADRISLLALLCGVVGLWSHIRFRSTDRRLWGAAGWLFFVMALLSRESGAVAFVPYLLYDVLFWRKTHPERWPGAARMCCFYTLYCAPVAAFALVYLWQGYGVSGYYSLFDEKPTAAAAALSLAKNICYYASGLLLLVPFSPGETFLRTHGTLASVLVPVLVTAAFCCSVFYPAVRKKIIKEAWFLFLGAWILVSFLPILPLVPQARHLYVPAAPFGLFAGASLASLLRVRGFGRLTAPVVSLLALFWVAAPAIGVAQARGSFKEVFGFQTRLVEETAAMLQGRHPPINIVFINIPSEAHVLALQHAFDVQTVKGAFRTYPLTVSKEVPRITVLGPRTLLIASTSHPFLESALERLFMTDSLNSRGSSRSNGFLEATVEVVRDGHIYAIRFDFAVPLDDEATRFFLIKEDGRPQLLSFEGGTMRVP